MFYTDGVTDVARDGDRLGDVRLQELMRSLDPALPASAIAATIEETAVAYAEVQPQDDMALVAVQVPRGFVRAGQFDIGGGPEAIGRARAVLADLLGDSVDIERLYDLQLVASEVVTNAVRHGGARQGEHVDLRVALVDDRIRLEVRDPGPGFDDIAPALPETDSGGGYGLYLVDLYSSDWGISGTEGTCVWLELPREGPGAAETA